jgi:E3 SUMO-protein ligase NSE2
MPAAATSHHLRKQPTEDIEDAMSTQPRDEEVDEDEAPSQPSCRSKDADKQKKPAIDLENDPEDVEEEEPIENLPDQPVDKQQAGRITGIAQDWEQMRKAIHHSSYALVRDIASSIAEFMDGERGEKVCDLTLSYNVNCNGLIEPERSG